MDRRKDAGACIHPLQRKTDGSYGYCALSRGSWMEPRDRKAEGRRHGFVHGLHKGVAKTGSKLRIEGHPLATAARISGKEDAIVKRFWMSWVQPTEDYRPYQESFSVYKGAALKPSKRLNYTAIFLLILLGITVLAWGAASLHEAGF